MPDLAYAMKLNPKMRVLLAGGYFDLATPFFEGAYEMHHMPIPQGLQKNIGYSHYHSGHMVYLNESVLRQFHDDVAKFVRETESGKCLHDRRRGTRKRAICLSRAFHSSRIATVAVAPKREHPAW